MARVRIWISDVPGIKNRLLIEQEPGRIDFYPLQGAPTQSDRLRTSYTGCFHEHPGTFYDLPFGFPANNQAAQQRLNDPSIPATIKKLIADNFPLNKRPWELVNS